MTQHKEMMHCHMDDIGPDSTAKERSLTSDEHYWLRIRAKVIQALADEGLEIVSDKDRVWLHRIHMKAWSVWCEGFSVTGQSECARLMGRVEAATFADACAELARRQNWGDNFGRSRLTYWGCRLFDNEADARRSFG